MIEIQGDIWKLHNPTIGDWIGITTNGYVSNKGMAVMGRGVALECAHKYPGIKLELGQRIKSEGNNVKFFLRYGIVMFPVKHNWFEKASLTLIEKSCKELIDNLDFNQIDRVFLPRPGCGNGQLTWDEVKPICERYLSDKIYIVEYKL